MTDPSRKILALRRKLYNLKDKRLIDDELREIQHDVVALEIQVSKLGAENVRLVHEANGRTWWVRMGNEDIAAELSATFDLNLEDTRKIASWILAPQEDPVVPF